VALSADAVADLGAFEAGLTFDPAVVTVESVEMGSFLASGGRNVHPFIPRIDNESGMVHFGACSRDEGDGAAGSGVLARVVFRVEACDQSTDLGLTDVTLTFTDGWPQELGGVTGGSLEIHCATSEVPTGADGLLTLTNRPNPLTSGTEIAFYVPASGGTVARTRLDIFDAAGRQVRTLVDGVLVSGLYRVEWDARDASGRKMPSGTYFSRLTSDRVVLSRSMQLVR
jgi:hypothetical protein